MKAEKYYYDFQNKLNKVSGLQELLGEKISGDVKFDYDPRGNVTNITEGRKTLGHYEFNKENLLKTAANNKGETTEFKYDGLNRRIGLKVESPEKRVIKEYSYVNDATTPYNSILMRYEKNLNSYKPQTESYIHGFGLESKETTNTWGEKKKNYYSHNELGSITREYNQEGNTTNSYEYDLFGVPNFREDTPSYTSYTHDQSTGLMYAQARYYLPEVGRFISEDSYKGTLPDPESQNRYVYCVSNPLRYVDPSGHAGEVLLLGCTLDGPLPFADAVAVTTYGGYNLYHYGSQILKVGSDTIQKVVEYISSKSSDTSSGTPNPNDPKFGKNADHFKEEQTNEYNKAKANKWKKPNGDDWWPDNKKGFDKVEGTEAIAKYKKGDELVRYFPKKYLSRGGYDPLSDGGGYTTIKGVNWNQLSLPGKESDYIKITYKLNQAININTSKVYQWFGQIGGGLQNHMPMSISDMAQKNILEVIMK